MAEKGFTLWLTGPSGAAKAALAEGVATELKARGHKVEVLDDESLCAEPWQGDGSAREELDRHVRRAGFVCRLLTRNDIIAVVTTAAPYRGARDEVRKQETNFVEVYVKGLPAMPAGRDEPGLPHQTPADATQPRPDTNAPFEEPSSPELVVETDGEIPKDGTARIIALLEEKQLITGAGSAGYSEEDEETVRRRLEALGYV